MIDPRSIPLATLLATAVLSTAAVGTCNPPPPEPPVPTVDAGPDAPADAGSEDGGGEDACAVTCTVYRRLACPEGEPTAKGRTCEDVCENARADGIMLAKDRACVVRASTCVAARACP